ncbi:MAG: hypothetical protein H7Z42_16810 [Roseiflexaceae bacterium]|nr:hypothetical protein [Roseiflexaceae bacterium]
MVELAFLIAIIFAGLIILTPIIGITAYIITRPWLMAYRQRQCPAELYNAVNLYAAERPESNATRGYTTGER